LTHRRDEDLELAAVSLGAVATEAWHSVETEDATLSVEAGQEILANKSSLLRLLENLFRNAVEHGGSDTTVEVGMFGTEGDGPNGFFVADDGPGIPPEDRSRVFEDGFSTRHGGTGLGLSIARDIAGAHDWTIDLTDDAEGARFEFTGVQLAEGEGDE
jgi:signal transduction histidine kinase